MNSDWWIELADETEILHDNSSYKTRCFFGSLKITSKLKSPQDFISFINQRNALRVSVNDKDKDIRSHLSRVFAFNDDYVCAKEAFQSESEEFVGMCVDSVGYSTVPLLEHEKISLYALQNTPKDIKDIDYYRLDILLEDYLNEIFQHNEAIRLTANKHMKRIPVFDINIFLIMPHNIRLDLCVLLTSSIMFSIPEIVFTETLLFHFHEYLNLESVMSIQTLPAFAKTAIISIIKRICRIELEELKQLNKFRKNKINIENYHILPRSTLISENGFNHLRLFYNYILNPIKSYSEYKTNELQESSVGYTMIEMDILNILPDIPTVQLYKNTDKNNTANANSYTEWISYTARHTVILLMKSSTCPSLIHNLTNKFDQDNYIALLPLLTAAALTHSDMNIQNSNIFGIGNPSGLITRDWLKNISEYDRKCNLYNLKDSSYKSNNLAQDKKAMTDETPRSPRGQSQPNVTTKSKFIKKYRNCQGNYANRPIPIKLTSLDSIAPIVYDDTLNKEMAEQPNECLIDYSEYDKNTTNQTKVNNISIYSNEMNDSTDFVLTTEDRIRESSNNTYNDIFTASMADLNNANKDVIKVDNYNKFKLKILNKIKLMKRSKSLTSGLRENKETKLPQPVLDVKEKWLLLKEMGSLRNVLNDSDLIRFDLRYIHKLHIEESKVNSNKSSDEKEFFMTSVEVEVEDNMNTKVDCSEEGSINDSEINKNDIKSSDKTIQTSYQRRTKWHSTQDKVVLNIGNAITAPGNLSCIRSPTSPTPKSKRCSSSLEGRKPNIAIVGDRGWREGTPLPALHQATSHLKLNPSFRITMKRRNNLEEESVSKCILFKE